jgi:reductive dehalogenase
LVSQHLKTVLTDEDRNVNKVEREKLEKEYIQGKIPYAVDSSFKRFNERNIIFSRVTWDQSYNMFMHPVSERAARKVGNRGYSRPGYSAQSAAWTIYDHFHGAFNWNSVKADFQSSPTQLNSALPKFKTSDPKENNKIIKRVAQVFGSCGTGIAHLDANHSWIYTHDRENNPISLPDGVEYAIVMLCEMDYDALKTSPSLPSSITVGDAYSRMAYAIACLAEFIRDLGYQTIPAGNGTGLSVPLAIDAGLGQAGRNGMLVTPKFGQRVRICKVYTDLPLIPDQPIDFGVTQFCRTCKKCAKHCPSQSIPYDTDPTWESPWNTISNNSGSTYKWYVNVDTCYEFWVKNSADCSNCLRVCPFTKPQGMGHDIARYFIKNFPVFNKFWLWLDNFMAKMPWWRYGKKARPNQFWRSNKYLDRKI